MVLSQGFGALRSTGSIPGKQQHVDTMKRNYIICSLITLGLVACGLTACMSEKEEGKEGRQASEAELQAQAKITQAEAQKIALDRVPGGTIKEAELEKEKGKLIWSFDIATPGTRDITEVNVDALTGAVVDISKESVAEQAKEKKQEDQGKREKEDEDEREEK
jgi:uncharacterized membrane protein YkoI